MSSSAGRPGPLSYYCVARSILSVAKEVKRNKKNIKREKVFITHIRPSGDYDAACGAGDPVSQLLGSDDGQGIHCHSSKLCSHMSEVMTPPPPPLPGQPCEELTLALQEEVDNFVNSEILKIVGPSYHGNRNRDLDLDEEDWYEHVPDVEYEVKWCECTSCRGGDDLTLSYSWTARQMAGGSWL